MESRLHSIKQAPGCLDHMLMTVERELVSPYINIIMEMFHKMTGWIKKINPIILLIKQLSFSQVGVPGSDCSVGEVWFSG